MKEIQITQGQVTLVDDEDYEYLNQWKWRTTYNKSSDTFYALRTSTDNKTHKTIYMHRLLLDNPDCYVDHINHNTLDNRKENLRLASPSESARNRRIMKSNSSGYKGVSWNKNARKWVSSIYVDRKCIHLGYFENIEDANIAYRNAAKKYHKDFSCD
jgi:hypothetical protein